MKRNRLPMLLAWVRGCAVFSLFGFWQEKRGLLLAAAAVGAILFVLFSWMSRRRRRDSAVDSLATAFPDAPAAEMEAYGLDDASDDGESVATAAASSPGIYGKIEVSIGEQTIGSYLVTDSPLTIGRDPAQSRIVIQESIISKVHCRIFAREGRVFVKDLDSTNGVYVNGEKVSECELRDHDEVFLSKKGTVKIVFHCVGGSR